MQKLILGIGLSLLLMSSSFAAIHTTGVYGSWVALQGRDANNTKTCAILEPDASGNSAISIQTKENQPFLTMLAINKAWNITADDSTQIDVMINNGKWGAIAHAFGKHALYVRFDGNIMVEFLDGFVSQKTMFVIFPAEKIEWQLNLAGSKNATAELVHCIKTYIGTSNTKPHPPYTPASFQRH